MSNIYGYDDDGLTPGQTSVLKRLNVSDGRLLVSSDLKISGDVIPTGYTDGYDISTIFNADGKIMLDSLEASPLTYRGTWNANTNTPDLTQTLRKVIGATYIVSTGGTQNIGNGLETFNVRDMIIYGANSSGTPVWTRLDNTQLSEIKDTTSSIITTYSSDKLDTLLSGKSNTNHTHTVANITDFSSATDTLITSKINDTTTSASLLWSSNKTNLELSNKLNSSDFTSSFNTAFTNKINDSTTSTTQVWSSSKTNSAINNSILNVGTLSLYKGYNATTGKHEFRGLAQNPDYKIQIVGANDYYTLNLNENQLTIPTSSIVNFSAEVSSNFNSKINDSTTSTSLLWSSSKIDTVINSLTIPTSSIIGWDTPTFNGDATFNRGGTIYCDVLRGVINYIELKSNNNASLLSVSNSSVSITAPAAQITAPTTTIFGNLNVTGSINSSGGVANTITKDMIGLGNVDNTSDVNKPISTATQNALNLKANIATPTFEGDVTIDNNGNLFCVGIRGLNSYIELKSNNDASRLTIGNGGITMTTPAFQINSSSTIQGDLTVSGNIYANRVSQCYGCIARNEPQTPWSTGDDAMLIPNNSNVTPVGTGQGMIIDSGSIISMNSTDSIVSHCITGMLSYVNLSDDTLFNKMSVYFSYNDSTTSSIVEYEVVPNQASFTGSSEQTRPLMVEYYNKMSELASTNEQNPVPVATQHVKNLLFNYTFANTATSNRYVNLIGLVAHYPGLYRLTFDMTYAVNNPVAIYFDMKYFSAGQLGTSYIHTIHESKRLIQTHTNTIETLSVNILVNIPYKCIVSAFVRPNNGNEILMWVRSFNMTMVRC